MKTDRITIINNEDTEIEYQCDLCDKKKEDTLVPFLSWKCWHDDWYIATIVCMDCIAIMNGEDK